MRPLLQRIGKRNWEDLRNFWLTFIPLLKSPFPFRLPGIISHPDLKQVLEEIIRTEKKTTVKKHYHYLSGFQALALQEALLLFYKSLNVLRCSHVLINDGALTWSVNNAYQSSFFCCKSIMAFLGISISRIDGKDFIADIFPYYSDLTIKEIDRRRQSKEILFLKIRQLNHWEVWAIFQRLLRMSNVSFWEDSVVEFIINLPQKVFAKQRNRNLYNNNEWLFDDLSQSLFEENYAIRNVIDLDNIELDAESEDFTMILCYILIRMGFSLLESISEKSLLFRDEFETVISLLESEDNHLYREFFALQNIT